MSIEKRFQVFVSSTYTDLRAERQQVIQALLELDCMPCSMEFFPAASEEVWDAIKSLIDDCDYYLVIVGGRYGSVDEEGISYTQKEYEYAVSEGKPVLAFLPKEPGKIEVAKSELNPRTHKKLEAFKELCRKRLCAEWESADDLRAKVTTSLVKLMKHHPAVGWVRGNLIPDESAAQTINRLRTELDQLKAQKNPVELETFAQGEDEFEVHYALSNQDRNAASSGNPYQRRLRVTWNEIFFAIAPRLMSGTVRGQVNIMIDTLITKKLDVDNEFAMVAPKSREQIEIQLAALDLIAPSPSGNPEVWILTPRGFQEMVKLRAIRRDAT